MDLPVIRQVAKQATTMNWFEKNSPQTDEPQVYVVKVNLDEIEHVTVDRQAKTVASLYLSTGESLSRPEPPSFWIYVGPVIFPVIGFLIPWGSMSIIMWVVAGFASK